MFLVSTLLGLGLCHRLRRNDLEGLSKNRSVRIITHPSSIAANSKFASILKTCSTAYLVFVGTTLPALVRLFSSRSVWLLSHATSICRSYWSSQEKNCQQIHSQSKNSATQSKRAALTLCWTAEPRGFLRPLGLDFDFFFPQNSLSWSCLFLDTLGLISALIFVGTVLTTSLHSPDQPRILIAVSLHFTHSLKVKFSYEIISLISCQFVFLCQPCLHDSCTKCRIKPLVTPKTCKGWILQGDELPHHTAWAHLIENSVLGSLAYT